jgi:hypothetical protein
VAAFRELSYAIVARISSAVVDNGGVVSCFIRLRTQVAPFSDRHSSSWSSSTAPTRRITAAGWGKMPTTYERPLISLFRRSSGFVPGMIVPVPVVLAGCVAYGATIRDKGTGEHVSWAGRCA